MASLSTFISLLKREIFSASKTTSLRTLLAILVVFALEKMLTTTNIFKCPKERYQVYGGMFLFVPPFCLAGLTLLTSNSIWDSATCRVKGSHARKIVCSKIFFELARASLVGVSWLVLAFATTDIYVCFRIGATESDSRREEMRAQSTMAAWAVLVVVMAMSLLYIAMKKCCCRHHDRECTIQILRDYERLETEAAVSKFKEEVKVLAKKQGEKQVMDILSEIEDGKKAHEVVRKAKNMLLLKSSKMKENLENCCGPCGTGNENGEEETMLITTV